MNLFTKQKERHRLRKQIYGYPREQEGFPYGSGGKESACNGGDQSSIPGLGRFPGQGNGNPLQCMKVKSENEVTQLCQTLPASKSDPSNNPR